MKYKIPFQIFKQFAVSHKSSTTNRLFLKHDKSQFIYPIPLSFSLAYTLQTLVNYRTIMSNSQYSSPDSYSSDLYSTWSSVSRLSKSSERHVLRFSSLRSSASPLVWQIVRLSSLRSWR